MFLGEIINRNLYSSRSGRIVIEEWMNSAVIRPNIELDEFVVMPNHIHGIIIIKNKINVETHCNASLHHVNNLSYIIRGFKSSSTKRIHLEGNTKFAWQPRFYDRIIRNEIEFHKIREYIRFNPLKWDSDEENPVNIKTTN